MYVCKYFAETPEPQDESCPKHGFPTSKGRACHKAGIYNICTYDPSTNNYLNVSFIHFTLQTFTRLQKLMISLSHGGMISLMDNIAEGHNEEVLEWQDEFSQMLCTEANNPSNSEVCTQAA